MAGPIRISILADGSRANRAFASVGASANGMGVRVGKAGKAVGLAAAAGFAIAGVAAAKFVGSSVQAASDAQQSLGATETVFGKFADKVVKTSDKAATKYGLSANVYRENANLLGSLFKGQGVAVDQLAGKTQKMIGTAADLSATFGGTTSDAVEALGSAFKGEFDPLERYGISIKQSDINARLAAKGQSKLTGAALKQAQQLATTELITKQAAQAHGAFAKESDTLAHQQQVLGAQWDNLKAKVGSGLLPVLTGLLTAVNSKLPKAFDELSARVAPAVAWVKSLFTSAGSGTSILSTLTAFLRGQVVPAVQSIITAFQGFLAVVLPIIQQVAAVLIAKWAQLRPQVLQIWGSIKNIVISALSIVRSVIRLVTAAITVIWAKFGATLTRYITTYLGNVVTYVRGVFRIIEGIFQVVSSLLKGDWRGMWEGIKKIASGALLVLKATISQAWNVIRTVTTIAWGLLKAVVGKAWDGIKAAVRSGISGAIQLVSGLPGKITAAVGDLGHLLADAGSRVIQGLIDGINSKVDDVRSTLTNLTGKLTDWKGPPKKDGTLLTPAGRLLMRGLVRGILDGAGGVEKALKQITDRVAKSLDKRYDGRALRAHTRAVMRSLRDEYAALTRNGKAQDLVAKALDSAKKKLEDARKAATDYAASVRDAITGTGSLSSLGSGDGFGSVGQLIAKRAGALAQAQRFAEVIGKLKGKLNDTDLRDLLSQGPASLGTAEAILAGGPAAIAQLNSLQAQLAKVGSKLGDSAADQFYGAGVQAAQGMVNGLEDQAKRLDRAAVRLANALVRAVKKALGIKSPSRVFKGLGGNVIEGLRLGLDDTYVRRSGATMAASLVKGFGTPALDAWASTGGTAARPPLSLRLSATEVDQLRRGRELRADLDAWDGLTGKGA